MWYACVWRTQSLLDSTLSRGSLLDFMGHYVAPSLDSEESPLDKNIQRRGEPKSFAVQRRDKFSAQLRNGATLKREPRLISYPNQTRYIVFRSSVPGQGSGNIVHGFLAVHALAEEFGRVVCAPQYNDFNAAFQPVDPKHVEACNNVKDEPMEIEIRLVNYEGPPDECVLKERLASDQEVIYILG